MTGHRGKVTALETLILQKKVPVNTCHSSPLRGAKNCTVRANVVCLLLSEGPGMAMYQEGQGAGGATLRSPLTRSDRVKKNLKPQQ